MKKFFNHELPIEIRIKITNSLLLHFTGLARTGQMNCTESATQTATEK